MATTQPINSKYPANKTNFVSQLKTFRTRFPGLAANFMKRLSFCASSSAADYEEQNATTLPEFDSINHPQAPQPDASPRKHLKFSSEVCMIPHPAKRKKGGEDAYFVTEDGCALGVSDGVGGWSDKGVDSSLYSKTLMREAKNAYESLDMHDPLQSLKHAATKANKIMGSATACILSIDDSVSCLRSANLGDSGFLLIRDASIIFRTKEQQFHFNFPYQLGPTSRARPQDADLASLELREGDKIVLGTDGLFDNLFDFEILQIVNQKEVDGIQASTNLVVADNATKQPPCIQGTAHLSIADQLAKRAAEKSRSSTLNTPFSQNAKANGMKVLGGKLDDITVLFAVVTCDVEEQSSPTQDSLLH